MGLAPHPQPLPWESNFLRLPSWRFMSRTPSSGSGARKIIGGYIAKDQLHSALRTMDIPVVY